MYLLFWFFGMVFASNFWTLYYKVKFMKSAFHRQFKNDLLFENMLEKWNNKFLTNLLNTLYKLSWQKYIHLFVFFFQFWNLKKYALHSNNSFKLNGYEFVQDFWYLVYPVLNFVPSSKRLCLILKRTTFLSSQDLQNIPAMDAMTHWKNDILKLTKLAYILFLNGFSSKLVNFGLQSKVYAISFIQIV